MTDGNEGIDPVEMSGSGDQDEGGGEKGKSQQPEKANLCPFCNGGKTSLGDLEAYGHQVMMARAHHKGHVIAALELCKEPMNADAVRRSNEDNERRGEAFGRGFLRAVDKAVSKRLVGHLFPTLSEAALTEIMQREAKARNVPE